MTTKRVDVSGPGFSDDDSPPASNLSSMQRAIVTIQKMRAKIEALERTRTEPIAIIGMACRIPGGANTPEAFFKLLEDGVDAVTEVPSDRWRVEPEGPNSEGEARALRWGAFLKDVDLFDASFFGISPREAESLDPQHRLLLEVTWEALERAGQLPERLWGTKAGVFVGIWAPDYQLRVLARDPNDLDAYCFTGTVLSTAAGRLSYTLGVQGPCMSIDTACSSSLTAIHLACQSLRNGESSMAIAGGVNMMLAPTTSKLLSKTQALSPDGRCKTFDARANGYVRGEGCGMLILKRLSDAERDGDTILALIRGSAVNQDGRSTGLTAPNVLSQQALLRQALESARLAPQDIAYLETHGTGTSLGDPIEVEAIKTVLGAPRERGATCVLGALKSNIGHLEAAAGVAGIIKVVLALQNEKIPGNLHFRSLNPRIDLRDTSLEIAQTARSWAPGIRPRYAGVSSFGISGTNAHVIVEEAPRNLEEALLEEASTSLLPISAKTPEALRAHVRAFRDMLQQENGPRLVDIVHTASARRSHYVHRLAVVGQTKDELAQLLDAYLRDEISSGMAVGKATPARAKVVFVFSGQGSQWLGMGRQLYETDASFRSVIDTCDNLMTSRLNWSILDELDAPEAMSRMGETQVAQPLLFAIQVALVEMLRSWGISPDAMIGHSVGEIAAAHVAGILSLDEAIRLVAIRGRIMQKATGMGKMVSVSMTPEEAQTILAGYEDRVSIAAINDPGSVVLSGSTSALDDVIIRCEKRGFATRPLRVDYAFHSPQMDAFERELVERLARVDTRRATLAMYSTVLADCVDGKELDVRYWGRNIRQTVDFTGAVFAALRDGYQLFLEIAPHPVLTNNIQQCLVAKKVDGAVNYTMRRNRDQRRTLLEAAGTLYARGCLPEWSRVVPSGGKTVPLPTYPWQRERHWIEGSVSNSFSPLRPTMQDRESEVHPLLGSTFSLSFKPHAQLWQKTVGNASLPWISDHIVQDAVVFPGAGYVEMAIAAATSTLGAGPLLVENLAFERMLAVPDDVETPIQVLLELVGGRGDIHIASQSPDAAWLMHAHGHVSRMSDVTRLRGESLETIQARCDEWVSGAEHYKRLEAFGLKYGACFRGLEQSWIGRGEALAQIATTFPPNDGYHLHPGRLDACFQVAALLASRGVADGSLVPVGISRYCWHGTTAQSLWVHARESTSERKGQDIAIDLTLCTDDGEVLAEVEGLTFRRLAAQSSKSSDPLAGCTFELVWRDQPIAVQDSAIRPDGAWLILSDATGIGNALAQRLRMQGWQCVLAIPGARYERIEPDLYHFDPHNAQDFWRITNEPFGKARLCVGAIHLLGLDAEPIEQTKASTLERDELRIVASAISLTQVLAQLRMRTPPRLILVTRAACDTNGEGVAVSPIQATLWGLGRTISLEHPDLECTLIDLERLSGAGEIDSLLTEVLHPDGEYQIGLRAMGRRVARIASSDLSGRADSLAKVSREMAQGRPFRLGTTKPGVLEHLTLYGATRDAPEAGMVEIEVEAAGLNFLDVLLAMGILPDDSTKSEQTHLQLGLECSGRVVALGAGVTDLSIGQEVLALGLGSMASHVVTRRELVAPKPETLDWAGAATLPIVFLTAYHCLAHVARIARGERVLIHAGAGGVGMAAIQWAKHVGAEIFATAGSESKREFLRSLGVHHVLDSRSISFANEIRRITNGEGIDVVLNSLSGDFISASFDLLRDYGRFVEIGKRDYYEDRALGLKPFLKNLSYTLVDLRGMILKRPERVAAMLADVLGFFRDGVFTPLRCETYGIARVVDAFTQMAQAKHVGKIAISMRDPEATLVTTSPSPTASIRPDGTYLITGGRGGLGLSLAQWMVQQGARNLALLGRSAPSEMARKVMDEMTAMGATICNVQADISRWDDTQAALTQLSSMPPLRGIVHAAGVLDDHTLLDLDVTRLDRVFAPKARGAWNLHEATKHMTLDFFVMYSSATGLLGSPGQSTYSAANAFLDALASARRSMGLPAVSVQWGPFSDVGMAASTELRGGRLKRHGLDSLSPSEGTLAFSRVLRGTPASVSVMRFSVRRWLDSYPQAAASPFWSELRKETVHTLSTPGNTFRQEIATMDPEQQFARMERHVLEQLARVVRIDIARIDSRTSFTSVGIDSLMSLELRNRLEASLGLKLPPTLLFTYASPFALAKHLLAQCMSQMATGVSRERPEITLGNDTDDDTTELLLPDADDDLLAAFDASVSDIKTEQSS